MNPLFTLGEEVRLHRSSRFRKKVGDAKFPFYHSFVPVLMFLVAKSCRSRAESVHLPETPFTMRKERREFQLCDSRRLRKKAQDTQDAVLRFLKFSLSVALTMRLRFLRFLRFSVYYAIYNMNWCFEIFEVFNLIALTRRLIFFLSNKDSGYYNTIRRGPKQVATKVRP